MLHLFLQVRLAKRARVIEVLISLCSTSFFPFCFYVFQLGILFHEGPNIQCIIRHHGTQAQARYL